MRSRGEGEWDGGPAAITNRFRNNWRNKFHALTGGEGDGHIFWCPTDSLREERADNVAWARAGWAGVLGEGWGGRAGGGEEARERGGARKGVVLG